MYGFKYNISKLFQSTILLWSAMIMVFFIITYLINLLVINRINVLPVLFYAMIYSFFFYFCNKLIFFCYGLYYDKQSI